MTDETRTINTDRLRFFISMAEQINRVATIEVRSGHKDQNEKKPLVWWIAATCTNVVRPAIPGEERNDATEQEARAEFAVLSPMMDGIKELAQVNLRKMIMQELECTK